jgi:arylsulfatase A-like enzyme
MADKQPNIVVFFWDNFGWGELGCYGGGVLRGAPTPRIDKIADEGLKLLNFNVEAQCTPSRSAILTGRHPIRSGTQTVPLSGGPDGLTRWEITSARALSDAGYATGMWGKWHLGSDYGRVINRKNFGRLAGLIGSGTVAAGGRPTRTSCTSRRPCSSTCRWTPRSCRKRCSARSCRCWRSTRWRRSSTG